MAVLVYATLVAVLVVPDNPLTRPVRAADPLRSTLGQRWNLFSPQLNEYDLESVVMIRYADGSESRAFALTTRFRDASTRGVKRFFPSRLVRVLEGAEIELNQLVALENRFDRLRSQASTGDPVADAVLGDRRFTELVSVTERHIDAATTYYLETVQRLAEHVLPLHAQAWTHFRVRLTAIPISPKWTPADFRALNAAVALDEIQSEATRETLSTATVYDSDWVDR